MSINLVQHRGSKLGWTLVVSAIALVALGTPVAANSSPEPLPTPAGWEVQSSNSLGYGADHFTLRLADGPVVAHVVRADRDQVSLRAVVSHDRIAGPSASGERTSTMCSRLGCLAAVNADFARPGTDQPVGAVVSAGRVLRSPVATHHQFSVGWGPLMAAGNLEWSAKLVSSDLHHLPITGLNDRNVTDGIVMFTPAWGQSVSTNPGDTNLVVRFVGGIGELVPATTAAVEVVEILDGVRNVALAPGTAVLTGSGDAGVALSDLWARSERGAASKRALLRVDLGPDASESVGGTPVLVRDGLAWVKGDGTGFISGRHPRTAVGWDGAGRVLMVTVDGRQPGHSVGMSLPDLADFLVGIGAVEALNLDGGGSTTMVISDKVVNLPSDRLVRRAGTERLAPIVLSGDLVIGNVERPVSVALLLVPTAPPRAPGDPAPTASVPEADPMDDEMIGLAAGRELTLALPTGDPGSDPTSGAHAALLVTSAPVSAPGLSAGWVGVAVLLQLGLAVIVLSPDRLQPILSRAGRWGDNR